MEIVAKQQGFKTVEEFFESKQYSRRHILLYERIFGVDFVGVGGKETTENICKILKLKDGAKVLDIGCGVGGSAFYLAEVFGADVVGFDILPAMIEIAHEKLNKRKLEKVQFKVADATKVTFEPNSFDLILSRDTILHIPDKQTLFSKIFGWLKPDGELLVTDYCCGPQEQLSNGFIEYTKERGYTLMSVPQYGKVLEGAGFCDVNAINNSDIFLEILHKELTKFENDKEDILKSYTLDEYNSIVKGWKMKIKRCQGEDHQWGLFHAKKMNRQQEQLKRKLLEIRENYC